MITYAHVLLLLYIYLYVDGEYNNNIRYSTILARYAQNTVGVHT